MIEVTKYTIDNFTAWNNFLNDSKNSTFLFHRDFMEYHKDRFTDYSLMIWDNQKLVALLPANIYQNNIISHRGLTYGGFLLKKDQTLRNVINYFKAALLFLNQNKFKELIYKELPSVYTSIPSDEMQYVLFILKARLIRRDCSSAINLKTPLKFRKGKISSFKKGIKSDLKVQQEKNFEEFWNTILLPRLAEKHQIKPVHSLKEMNLLAEKFPDNIKLFTVSKDNSILAGTLIFEMTEIVHTQYIATLDRGQKYGAVDYLFHTLISNIYQNKNYFDFGISNEMNGKKLNIGLLRWKEGFGARTISHNFYQINTENYYLLDHIFEKD